MKMVCFCEKVHFRFLYTCIPRHGPPRCFFFKTKTHCTNTANRKLFITFVPR